MEENVSQKLPTILDGKFFTILSREDSRNVKAKCMLCTKEKVISGTLKPRQTF